MFHSVLVVSNNLKFFTPFFIRNHILFIRRPLLFNIELLVTARTLWLFMNLSFPYCFNPSAIFPSSPRMTSVRKPTIQYEKPRPYLSLPVLDALCFEAEDKGREGIHRRIIRFLYIFHRVGNSTVRKYTQFLVVQDILGV